MGPVPPNIAEHIPLYGSRLLHDRENLWEVTRRSDGRFVCEFGLWVILMNTTLRSAGHLGKEYDINLRFVQNYLWKTIGQLFRKQKS